MIQVELLEEDGEILAMANWTAIPDVGERFSTGQGDYEVIDRGWGICCKGDYSPIWGQQCVTLTLRKAGSTSDSDAP